MAIVEGVATQVRRMPRDFVRLPLLQVGLLQGRHGRNDDDAGLPGRWLDAKTQEAIHLARARPWGTGRAGRARARPHPGKCTMIDGRAIRGHGRSSAAGKDEADACDTHGFPPCSWRSYW